MKQKLNYRIVGQGEPLVFIHGILGFWRNFYSISSAFKDRYKVLLYDQRGHGRSFHSKPYTVLQLVTDLKDLLDELGWEKVTLVGHSLGGYVSYLFSQKHPDRFKKIVSVDSSPFPLLDAAKQISDILTILPSFFHDRNQARDFFKKSVQETVFSKALADFLMANLEKKQKGQVRFIFDREGILNLLIDVRRHDYSAILNTLKKPMLFMRGENSTHFLRSHFEKTLKINKMITGVEIKNSGHWLHSEQSQVFIKELENFISD